MKFELTTSIINIFIINNIIKVVLIVDFVSFTLKKIRLCALIENNMSCKFIFVYTKCPI